VIHAATEAPTWNLSSPRGSRLWPPCKGPERVGTSKLMSGKRSHDHPGQNRISFRLHVYRERRVTWPIQ
jgi:hypothetical protein